MAQSKRGKTIARRIGIPVAVAAVALGPVMVSGTADAATPTTAPMSWTHPDLHITNIGHRHLSVCHSWHHTTWTARHCTHSKARKLYFHQNTRSKFGWGDVDAVWVRRGFKIKERTNDYQGVPGVSYRYRSVTSCNRTKHGHWQKVQPTIWWTYQTRYFYLKKC